MPVCLLKLEQGCSHKRSRQWEGKFPLPTDPVVNDVSPNKNSHVAYTYDQCQFSPYYRMWTHLEKKQLLIIGQPLTPEMVLEMLQCHAILFELRCLSSNSGICKRHHRTSLLLGCSQSRDGQRRIMESPIVHQLLFITRSV